MTPATAREPGAAAAEPPTGIHGDAPHRAGRRQRALPRQQWRRQARVSRPRGCTRPRPLRGSQVRTRCLGDALLPCDRGRRRSGLGQGADIRGVGDPVPRGARGRSKLRPGSGRTARAARLQGLVDGCLPITCIATRRSRCFAALRSSEPRRRAAPKATFACCSRRTCASDATPQSTNCVPGTRRSSRRIEDRQRRAEQKVERERAQAQSETTSSILTVGGSVLGALFGGRRGSALAKASTAARRIGRVSKERADVGHAEADARSLGEQEGGGRSRARGGDRRARHAVRSGDHQPSRR